MSDGKQIYAAITSVMRKCGAIGKTEKNQSQGFNFRSIDAIYNRLQPLMAEAGIFSVPKVLEMTHETGETKRGGSMFHLWCRIEYTFFAEDGSSVEAVTIGESMDSGDKGGNKAMAAAHKYALVQLFNIPYEDMDPDAHTPEWVAESEGRITKAQFVKVKSGWWSTAKKDLSEADGPERERAFCEWARETSGEDFNAVNWREWTVDILAACESKLNNDAAEVLQQSGLK